MGSATYNCPNCGAIIKVSKGNNANSARYARWCEQQGRKCRDCETAEFRAAHEAAVAQAAADPRTAALPVLEGTVKEVAWAQALRLEALPNVEAVVVKLLDWLHESQRFSEAATLEAADAVQLIAQEVRGQTNARDWIETRGRAYEEFIRSEMKRRLQTLCPTAYAELKAKRAQREAQ